MISIDFRQQAFTFIEVHVFFVGLLIFVFNFRCVPLFFRSRSVCLPTLFYQAIIFSLTQVAIRAV